MRSSTKVVAAVLVLAVVICAAVGAYMLLKPAPSNREEGIPQLEYYTTDLAGALTEDDLYWIDQVCYEVDLNSSCQMAVVVVNDTAPYSMEYFALRTFQYNGIGHAGRDNGVLIVVATDSNAWRVEVGYGLEGILTDTRVARLAEAYLEPNITAGLYGDGLFELTAAIGEILDNEWTGDRSGDPAFPIEGIPLTWTDYAIIIAVVVVLSIVTRGRVLWPIIWILSLLGGRGGGGFGGGRSGGGGASGR